MNGLPRVEVKEIVVGAGVDNTPTNDALIASSFENGRVNMPIYIRSSAALENEFGKIDYNNIEKFGYGKLAAKTWLDGGNGIWIVRNSFYNSITETIPENFKDIANPNYVNKTKIAVVIEQTINGATETNVALLRILLTLPMGLKQ